MKNAKDLKVKWNTDYWSNLFSMKCSYPWLKVCYPIINCNPWISVSYPWLEICYSIINRNPWISVSYPWLKICYPFINRNPWISLKSILCNPLFRTFVSNPTWATLAEWSRYGPRFAAFSKIWPSTILRLLPFILRTNFRKSSKF